MTRHDEQEAEAALRLGHVRLGENTSAMTQRTLLQLLQHLQLLLRQHNPSVRDLIMACEVPDDQVEQMRLMISAEARSTGQQARRYNRPLKGRLSKENVFTETVNVFIRMQLHRLCGLVTARSGKAKRANKQSRNDNLCANGI
ncbi:hypothetical protein FJT64_012387 [Amphibalanus amphitrite]|uniref:Uncharacterized protein n=1 Tax=Amphibalanus amphitrite TaxID=1232801 RepID=A0A6A4VCS1_AMPAM|nr:hypothetical protein FJT64_012387 [Amphibalanus amphitrite]